MNESFTDIIGLISDIGGAITTVVSAFMLIWNWKKYWIIIDKFISGGFSPTIKKMTYR